MCVRVCVVARVCVCVYVYINSLLGMSIARVSVEAMIVDVMAINLPCGIGGCRCNSIAPV